MPAETLDTLDETSYPTYDEGYAHRGHASQGIGVFSWSLKYETRTERFDATIQDATRF